MGGAYMKDKLKQKAAKIRWDYSPDEVEFLVRLYLGRTDFTSPADRHRWYAVMRHSRDSLVMIMHGLDNGNLTSQAFKDELARQKGGR